MAQYMGAEGEGTAGRVTGQTVTFVGLLSVLVGIGGLFYTRSALEVLPSDPATARTVIPLAADYMEIIFLGMPLLFGFFVFSAIMRGYGDTRTPVFVISVPWFFRGTWREAYIEEDRIGDPTPVTDPPAE